MTVKSTTILLCNSAFACILLALFLQSYYKDRDGNSTGNIKISTDGIQPLDQKTTRPEITTPQGRIRGINLVTRLNRPIFGFIGIPYAQPPVGDLRFKSPVPAGPWKGTLDAGSDTESCIHMSDDDQTVFGREDCLYLNVYTPQLPKSDNPKLLPVMLYIIGGGFKRVNNSVERFPPQFLLDKDVVLVFPNYRLGVLGFLSTGDEVSPGNYGLKDLVQSLKWVQENIASYGGDPNQVTIYGGSAGAMAVHLLALSKSTDGLIHKYVTSGGTAFSYIVNKPKEVCARHAIQLGEHLGCPTNTSTLLVDCLKGRSASQLVNSNRLFYVWGSTPFTVWFPTTEPDVEGAVLTDTAENLYAAGKIRDLPWMGTICRDEGLMFSSQFGDNPDLFEDFLSKIDFVLPYMLGYQDVVDDAAAYTDALKSYYLNDLTADRSLLWDNFTLLVGDALFIYPTYYPLRQHLVLAKNPVYYVSLHFRGTFSHTYLFSGGSTRSMGVSHGDELLYLFGRQGDRLGPADRDYNELDFVMVDKIVQLWTSFATNGVPTTVESGREITWDRFSSLNNYIRIGNEYDTTIEMEYDLYLERMHFWDELTKAQTTSDRS